MIQQAAGLPAPPVRFRRIQKRGHILLLDGYTAHRREFLEGLRRAFVAMLERGYAILKDSVFVGIREPERVISLDAPQAKMRMLTIYLGKRKVRALPEFPLSHSEILLRGEIDDYGVKLSVEKVLQVISTTVSDVTIEQFAERLANQVGTELDRKEMYNETH